MTDLGHGRHRGGGFPDEGTSECVTIKCVTPQRGERGDSCRGE